MAANGRRRRGGGAAPAAFEYLKYWKPVGVTCTTDRRVAGNVIDAIGHARRIFPVGRLDKPTSGLLLLTSDGRVVNAVGRATEGHGKTYEVTADRDGADADVAALAAGVVITTVAQRDRGVAQPLTARPRPCRSRAPRAGCGSCSRRAATARSARCSARSATPSSCCTAARVMDIDLRGLREGECRPSRDEAELACLSDAFGGIHGPRGFEAGSCAVNCRGGARGGGRARRAARAAWGRVRLRIRKFAVSGAREVPPNRGWLRDRGRCFGVSPRRRTSAPRSSTSSLSTTTRIRATARPASSGRATRSLSRRRPMTGRAPRDLVSRTTTTMTRSRRRGTPRVVMRRPSRGGASSRHPPGRCARRSATWARGRPSSRASSPTTSCAPRRSRRTRRRRR